MSGRLSIDLMWLLFYLGALPAFDQLPWSNAMCVLWGALGLGVLLNRPALAVFLPHVLFLILAGSFWALANLVVPSLHWSLLILLLASCYFIGFFGFPNQSKPVEESSPDNPVSMILPGRYPLLLLVVVALALGMAMHFGLNLFLRRPFYMSWWTSLTWAGIGIAVAFPWVQKNGDAFLRSKKRAWLCPLFIVLSLAIHGHRHDALRLALSSSTAPFKLAEKAFHHGYWSLGIDGTLLGASRLVDQGQPGEAVKMIRKQWRHVHKESFAEAFRAPENKRMDYAVFITTFGCKLILDQNERAMDLALLRSPLRYRVLTDQGRIIDIGADGPRLVWRLENKPVAISVNESRDITAVLTDEPKLRLMSESSSLNPINLPANRGWIDVAFSKDGKTLWVLNHFGAVEQWNFNETAKGWEYAKLVSPALWSDLDLARKMIIDEKPGRFDFFVLDACAGVHEVGSKTKWLAPWSHKDLKTFYNANNPNTVDAAVWNGGNIMLMNRFGRVDVISPGLALRVKDLRSLYQDSIRAHVFFDRVKGLWYQSPEMVAVVPVEDAGTVLQLKQNGLIQAIAMPQGVRIFFDKPEARIDARSETLSPPQKLSGANPRILPASPPRFSDAIFSSR